MADILIRGIDEPVLERLKARAARHGRSLQSELKRMVEREAGAASLNDALERLEQFRRRQGRGPADSTEMIREDRGR